MRRFIFSFLLVASATTFANAELIISGVVDGPLSGGTPKAVELYAACDIADLSIYELDYYFNANTTPSVQLGLTGSATAGSFIYITPNDAEFQTFFGFAPTVVGGGSVNGDDSLVLQLNGADYDVFGAPGTDGTGQPWEYLDGWAYRTAAGPSTTFSATDWSFSGTNALDGETTNAGAATPFPIGTHTATMPVCPVVPEPSTWALGLLACLGLVTVRRRR